MSVANRKIFETPKNVENLVINYNKIYFPLSREKNVQNLGTLYEN